MSGYFAACFRVMSNRVLALAVTICRFPSHLADGLVVNQWVTMALALV